MNDTGYKAGIRDLIAKVEVWMFAMMGAVEALP
jgi:hypothetical protein